MKKSIYLLYLVASMNLFTSCLDVLNKSPLDLRTEEDVWGDVKLAQAYLNRLWYATGRHDYQNETWFSLYSGPLSPGSEITSDNCYSRWNRGSVGVKNDGGWSENTDYGLFDNFIDIRRANIAIDHLTAGCGFVEEIENDMLGQAYFAKGLIYVTRAKSFGGYPIIDKTLTPGDELSLPRASIKETFDYGIGLLNKAAGLLQKTPPSGRPGKGAAYGLLSEANLLAAAYINYGIINGAESHTELTSYYDAAIQAVADLDALGVYKLEPSSNWTKQFNDVDYAAGNPTEILLAQFTPPGLHVLSNDKMVETNCYLPKIYDDLVSSTVADKYNGKPFPGYTLKDGWQTIAPNPKTVEESFYIIDEDGKARRWEESLMFQKYVTVANGVRELNSTAIQGGRTDVSELMYANRDKRFYQTVAYDGSTYFGNRFDARLGGNMNPNSYKSLNSEQGALTGYLYIKPVPQTNSWSLADYLGFHRTCLRLSRAYLNAAEAYLMKDDWTNARTYMNRTRVEHGGLPALTDEQGEELWKIYLDERNAELMLENDRYYTLMRWGIKNGAEGIGQLNFGQIKQLEIAENGRSYAYVDLKFEGSNNNFVFSRFRYLFPVAKKYIDANPNYAPQNPRY